MILKAITTEITEKNMRKFFKSKNKGFGVPPALLGVLK
jgi:hypothetical protein